MRAGGAGPPRLGVNLALALVCLIWGTTWRVIKTGIEDLPPFFSAGLRFVLAAAVMSLVAAFLRRREGGHRPQTWLVGVMGVLNFGVSYGVVYSCETLLPSGVTSVLWATFPIMMAVLGHLFLPGEQLSPAQYAGFVGGFLGVGVLFLTDLRELGPGAVPMGLLLLTSPLVSAVGTVALKRHGGGASSLVLNRDSMMLGGVLLLLAAALFERGETYVFSPAALASVGYLAFMGSVVTFGIFFWLLRTAPAHRLSLVAYVVPLVAVLVGGLTGEPVGLHTAAGTALVVGGAFLAARRPVSRRPAPAGATISRPAPTPREPR